nr:hypothetical protein [Tanacetum cinerariifolium]
MMIYLKNTAGYKMDFFKGMSYDEICPIFQARFDANMRFLFKSREEMEEEDQEVLKSINETPAQKVAKRRKLNEEAEDLKKRLEVVDDEDDDVFTEATPLARKVPVVDYKIVMINNKPRFKIIKEDETHQLYISFITLLNNFDREDLENLWGIVKERFSTLKPTNFSDEYLLTTLKTMFEKPDGQDAVWKSQRSVHGLALVKSWKLLTSCGVHIITLLTIQLILLVEKDIHFQGSRKNTKCVNAANEELTAAKHKLMLLKLKLFKNIAAADVKTMDTTIKQQLAIDEALVPTTQRLNIRRSNFLLLSDIKSKESTLQLVYDATATVNYHSIRFKMDNKKHIIDLESFKNILHICPRVHGQPFAEPPFEKEILAFIHFLGHSAAIRTLTDVNINKLYPSWRSFAALINKCLTRKSSGYDSLRLSQAQILRNKVNWHYVRDNFMFSMIKLVSRHQNTQQFGALLPIELTNDEIRNSKAYKECYAITTGEAAPKPKASVKRTRSSSDTSITPPTIAASPRLKASAKGKQTAKASKAKSLSSLFKVTMTEAQQLKLVTKQSMQQMHISQPSGSGADEGTGDDNEEQDNDGDDEDEGDDGKEGNGDDDDDEDDDGEEGDDDADQEVVRDDDKDDDEEKSEDEGVGEEDLGLNIGKEERHAEEEEEDELYRDVNINQGRGLLASLEVEDSHVTLTPVKPDGQQESSSVSSQFVISLLNLTLDVGMESIFETTSQLDVPTPTSLAPLLITTPAMTSSTIATTTTTSQALILPTTIPSDIIQNLPSFSSLFCFDDRLSSLEENFSKVMQTNQFAGAVSAIPGIIQHYMDQRMNEAVKVAVQIQSDRLREEAQRENDEFLRTVDENIKKIIKEQVKEQVKAQVFKILPRIEQVVNEQLEAEVLTRSSHSSRTSYAVAADLSEIELKKILIEKMEDNKRRDDNEDKDEEPSGGQTGGQRDVEKASAIESALTEEPVHTTSPMEEPSHPEFDIDRAWNKTLSAVHRSIQPWISELAKQADTRSSFNKLMDTPLDFSNFLMNRLKVDTLTPKFLVEPTYELMKGSCKSLIELEYQLEEVYKATTDQLDWVNPEGQQYPHNLLQHLPLILDNQGRRVIPFEHFINNDLEYLRGGASSHNNTTSVTKTKAADYGHIKWIEYLVPRTMWIQEPIDYDKHALWGVSQWGHKRQQFYGFAVNRESARDIYSKRRIIVVTKLKIVEWHSYKHLDWITGFIYQNKDKKNRLMRIDELHKFSDGTLTDARTSLDDRLKGIQMRYLRQTI